MSMIPRFFVISYGVLSSNRPLSVCNLTRLQCQNRKRSTNLKDRNQPLSQYHLQDFSLPQLGTQGCQSLSVASIADGSVRHILEPGIRVNRLDDGSYEWWGFSTNLTVASAFANSRLRSKLSTYKVANSGTYPHIM